MDATVAAIGRARGRQGLSLVEVLVALAVVAIALFAIAATQTAAFTANVQAREIAEVRDIATQAVAEARLTLIEGAYAGASGWDDLLDATSCGAPTAAGLEGLAVTGARPSASDLPSCGGGFTVDGPDGVQYEVRWRFGVPGSASVDLPDGAVTSPQLALVRILLRVDWGRRGVERSMSFEDFVGCVDVDPDTCPDGPATP